MGNLDNVKIICTGFDVSTETKENILIVFQNLLDELPYDAFMNVSLLKVDRGIQGNIQVSSVVGEFSSHKVAMTPQSVADELYNDLHAQLLVWKSHRFTEHSSPALV